MEGSRAFAGRLIIKQAPRRQPRETDCNPVQSPPSPHAYRASSAEKHSRPYRRISLDPGEAVLPANRAATLTRPTCPLQPLASSLQQETRREDNRRLSLPSLTSSSTSTTTTPTPPRRHHHHLHHLHLHTLTPARTWSAVAVAHSHREVSAPVSASTSACTRPDPAVIIVSHLHWG